MSTTIHVQMPDAPCIKVVRTATAVYVNDSCKENGNMNDLMKVDYSNERPTVLGRELHAVLEVETPYHIWFPRMTEYGFTAGTDYLEVMNKNVQNPSGGRPSTNHQLTLDMAKELCMIQRTDKGKECRQYFLELERKWNSPEIVMARALQFSQKKVQELEATTAALLPKAEYYDALVDRNGLMSIRQTAQLLEVNEKQFIITLMERGYLYRDARKRLVPYAAKNKGYFSVKEYIAPNGNHTGVQTLVTACGRNHLLQLFGKQTA